MSSKTLRRGALALVVVSSFALARPTPAAARPGGSYRPVAVRPHAQAFLSTLWDLMVRLWGGEGTTSDPNGHH